MNGNGANLSKIRVLQQLLQDLEAQGFYGEIRLVLHGGCISQCTYTGSAKEVYELEKIPSKIESLTDAVERLNI